MQTRHNVLVVTAGGKAAADFARLLSPELFLAPKFVATAAEARQWMPQSTGGLVIIDTPLPDDFGIRLAEDLARCDTAAVLLLVGSAQFEQVSVKAGALGVLTLPKPVDRMAAMQAVSLTTAMLCRLEKLSARAQSLQEKMDEIRLVNRAKLLLVQHLGMSEAEAHRYIEKAAMDRCCRKGEIAGGIIRTYES